MVLDFNEMGYLSKDYKITFEEFIKYFVSIDDPIKRNELFKKYQDYNKRFGFLLTKIWVGGSYVTDKTKPNDIDLTVHYEINIFNNLTRINATERIHFKDKKYVHDTYKCHTQYVPVYPENHPKHILTELQAEKWYKWFTKDRKNTPKGIVELEK